MFGVLTGSAALYSEALETGLLPDMPARDPRWITYHPQGARCTWGLTAEPVAALGCIPHRDAATAPVTNAMEICVILHLCAARIVRVSDGKRAVPCWPASVPRSPKCPSALTCLRLSGCKVGLLMNFNSVVLKDGLRRFAV